MKYILGGSQRVYSEFLFYIKNTYVTKHICRKYQMYTFEIHSDLDIFIKKHM
jgi:hypothetical protein